MLGHVIIEAIKNQNFEFSMGDEDQISGSKEIQEAFQLFASLMQMIVKSMTRENKMTIFLNAIQMAGKKVLNLIK